MEDHGFVAQIFLANVFLTSASIEKRLFEQGIKGETGIRGDGLNFRVKFPRIGVTINFQALCLFLLPYLPFPIFPLEKKN